MATTRAEVQRGMTKLELRLVILLAISIFINYVDRGNLSVAAPLLEKELSINNYQLGWLLSSFFWTYALVQLFGIAGWLTDRFPVGWVLAVGFLLWSAATAATGMVTGFTALFVMRLILGVGESVAYPCYSKILAGDFPQQHRGVANSIIDAASKIGPALGTLAGGMLVATLGWRMFFIVLGVGCLVWLIPWIMYMPRDRAAAAVSHHKGPGLLEVLGQRSAWGCFLGHFCGNYYWYFLITWLPTYLVRERKYSMQEMATVGSIAYLAIAVATLFAGWWSDRHITKGGSPTFARKACVAGGLMGASIIVPVSIIHDEFWSIALLLCACAFFGFYTSNNWAISQTLSGPLAAGRWTSVQNGVGNLAGIAAPALTGFVVETTGAFYLAFLVAAAVSFVGAFFWAGVIGPIERVKWKESEPVSVAQTVD